MSKVIDDLRIVEDIETSQKSGKKLFDRVGGRETVLKVHTIFYDKLYAHPWLGQFFHGIDRAVIETQQTDFMSGLFGGPKNYSGRMPIDAHEHLMITEELFALRQELLRSSLEQAGVSEDEILDWLKFDAAFKKVLVKKSLDDCRKRFFTDQIVDIPKPHEVLLKKA